MLGMYVLGGISTYWFIRFVWFRKIKNNLKIELASAIGALFYLFNLGTLQQFHVPLEMFAVHFATFGFVIGSVHLFITTKKKKYALFIFISQLLAAPSAHTATLFYMYTGLLLGYGFLLAIFQQTTIKKSLHQLLIAFLLIIAANFYWLAPNIYYISTNSDTMKEAKINRNFSDEAFWQNQAFGEVTNVVTFRNFLFNWKVYDYENRSYKPMFDEWEYLSEIEQIWPYFLGLIFVMGIIFSFDKNRKEHLPLLAVFSLAFLFLNNINFPLEKIYLFIISLSDTLKEALRFPFTKFSIVFIFAGSVYFAMATHFILEKTAEVYTSKLTSKAVTFFVTAILVLTILYPTKPFLTGGLISNTMKVDIPQKYFDLFTWFESKSESERIAMFPIIDFWPWIYYDWSTESQTNGYQGGGFMWFGLQQPLLNREFDRWAPQNEFFYHEINTALFQNDIKLFNNTIQKYDVTWLIYDNSIIDPQEQSRKTETLADTEIQKTRFKEFINNSDFITLANVFEDIEVYYIDHSKVTNPQKVQKTGNIQPKILHDTVFETQGDYIADKSFDNNYLFSNIHSELLGSLVSKDTQSLQISAESQTFKKDNNTLVLPSWQSTGSYLPVEISAQVNNSELTLSVASILPTISSKNETIQLNKLADKIDIDFTSELEFDDDYYQVVIEKNTTTLDPLSTDPQNLGLAYISATEDLFITLEAAYDTRSQVIRIPKETLSVLFPKQKELKILSIDTITISYNEQTLKKIVKDFDPTQTYFETNCSEKGEISFKDEAEFRLLTAKNGGIACQGFLLRNLPKSDGYLVYMDLEKDSGPSPFVQANEFLKTKIFFQETPMSKDNFYGLFPENNNDLSYVLVNRSYGSYPAVSKLYELNITPLPFEYIASIIVNENLDSQETQLPILKSLKPQTTDFYSVLLAKEHERGVITLEQSHNPGWIALSLGKLTPLTHYPFNTWANAWEVSATDKYVIVFFWPQLFAWIGFVLIGITIVYLYYTVIRHKKVNWKKVRSVFINHKQK